MRELAPGVYADDDGTLHLDLPEMCEAAGFPPTQENQDLIEEVAFGMFDAAIVERIADGGGGGWR